MDGASRSVGGNDAIGCEQARGSNDIVSRHSIPYSDRRDPLN
jgi:hypothetical protein